MKDSDLLKSELLARENARAKVRDVSPAEKSRIACQRAEKWLRVMDEIEKRGLKPLR
tara:strand:+ start:465 stop:635 length:171 start_codon:yes stop_codon:yes gene_type:complete